MRLSFLASALFLLPCVSLSQAPDVTLGRHDFLYAGESKERRIFLVRGGQVVWSYDDPSGRGEISDATMLSNGNILFAHQFAVEEITQEKKTVWRYDVPAGHEVHTVVPIGLDRVLYIQNGNPALLRVVNIRSGVMEKESVLKTKNPDSVHGQFRHARLTANGTLLVAHMDLDRVVEYDVDGNELWSFPGTHIWGVTPLENGNVLVTDSLGVREITRRGDAAWSWKPGDTPGIHVDSLQQAWRLPNGNTVVNNWVNEWSQKVQPGSLQAIELTPEKQVVWVLRSSADAPYLGPSTTLQFLDSPSRAENVHFGAIR
ncbi:PQQ-binding-like beta-propeller repeat protein [Granulicella sibirica]|uniref:Arylsulfotransferase (ASST) n=1 Tax=Granulicella sibirica TaxID=2479048 RepID=A0A4Q0T1Z9_9BACT|nr:PQQ-binding-like beta-propeller repeat protein [Granulicella sibirica]RXH55581.1 hypothetical protein GRAN_2438 [Granulicella sibirica]